MKFKAKFLTLTASILLASAAIPTFNLNTPKKVLAAHYTSSETKKVRNFEAAYHKLDNTVYSRYDLYSTAPNFNTPFVYGELVPGYITTSMNYINYYRSLFGLPQEANNPIDNTDAQIGASALASVNAETSLQAHGLIGYKKPSYISKKDWAIAENATLGNINFLESDDGEAAGEIVTDLLQDRNNIAGAGNTGHRALLLSARASRMGIGAAYGKSNYKFYSVENGVFADDILRPATKSIVTYPSATVFPYELIDTDTPWSAYFANKTISRTPTIYITDLTINKKYRAKYVRNFGTDYYSDGYKAAVTFKPSSSMKIVNTHKYKVQIGNYYSYSFRLFRQKNNL